VNWAISVVALLGFFASLIVHVTTFFGVDPSKHAPWVWALHFGIFVVFFPMVFAQRGTKKEFWGKLNASLPRWGRYAVKALFAYALVNFALFLFLSKGGVPEESDGRYVLRNHGEIIRELSPEEYERQKAYVLRGFSGHWMVFYMVPALFFWYRKDEHPLS
jgi:hypothetical protein